MRVAFLGGVRWFFGRFDGDFYAFRRFSLVSNGFRKFSAVLIRCRAFSCGFRRFPKIAQRRRRQRLTGKSGGARARPGASGRVRACPGAAGVRACPGDKKQCCNCLMGIRVALYSDALSGRARAFPGEAPQSPRAGGARPRRAWNSMRPGRKTKKQSRNVEIH